MPQQSSNRQSVILEKLKSGNADSIDKDVTEFLSPALNATKVSTDLLEAVEECYRFYRQARDKIVLNEALAIPKLLYHILTKIPVKGFQKYIISLCNYLYDELVLVSDCKNDMASTIVSNTYSRLWNLAIKQEQEIEGHDWEILQLRHLILKILLLKPGTANSVTEKLVLALTRFEKMILQKEKILDETSFPVVDLVADTLTCLHNHKLTIGEELSPLLLHQFLLKLGTQYDIKKAIKYTMTDISLWSVLYQENTEIYNIYRILYYYGNQIFVWMYSNNKEKAEKNFPVQLGKEPEQIAETLPKIVESISHDRLYIVIDILLIVIRYVEKTDLQTDRLLSVLKTLSKINQVLLKWKPEQDKQAKIIIDLVQTQMKILFNYIKSSSDKEEFRRLIDVCEDITQSYSTLLQDPESKGKDHDRHYCGYLVSKLAQMCFEKNLFQMAIVFYKIACLQLNLYVNSDNTLKQTRMDEVCLGRKYISLAEIYLEYGDTYAAIEAIISCVLVHPSHVIHAVKVWVKVKKDLIKNGSEEMNRKTFGQSVFEQDKTVDLCILLKAENDMFKSTRKRFYPAEIEILQQLIIEAANQPLIKGKALLEIALVHWQSGLKGNRDILEYLKQAESVLVCIKNSHEVLGQVYLWQYVINHEEMSAQILSSIDIEVPKAEPGEEHETVIAGTPSVYMTVVKEKEATELLDKAVALWDTLGDDINDASMLLQSIMTCARVYQLLRKHDMQLHVIKMYHKLADKFVCTVTSDATSLLIESLISVGMVSDAEQFIESMDDWDQQKWKEQTTHCQIAKCCYKLCSQQYEEGLSILNEVLSVISAQNKTWTVSVLEGKAKRLMSQFLTFPHKVKSDYSLDYAYEAVRFHTGVVQFLLGKEFLCKDADTSKGNSVDRWTALIEVLESLYNLGYLYFHIGEAREAKCYLKEGWKIARYFGLPSWNIKFSTEIAKLHSTSDKGEEAVKYLSEIYKVLSPTTTTEPPAAEILVPECINHILEQNLCYCCNDNLLLILNLVPMVTEVYIVMEHDNEAILMLEKMELAVRRLIKEKNHGNNFKNFVMMKELNFLHMEILTYIAELCMNQDMSRSQQLVKQGEDISGSVQSNFVTQSRLKLCQSLCGFNQQCFHRSSSDCDTVTVKCVSTEDLFDCLPVVNLSKKFEKMSVKNKNEVENTSKQILAKKNIGRKEKTQSIEFDTDAMETNVENHDNVKTENVKSVKKTRREPTKNKPKKLSIDEQDNGEVLISHKNTVENTEKNVVDDSEDISSIKEKLQKKPKLKKNSKLRNVTEFSTVANEAMETPSKTQPKLLMKTPRSVCSRKAVLDLIMDSDEDDIKPLTSVKKKRPGSKRQSAQKSSSSNKDIYKFSDEENTTKSGDVKNKKGSVRCKSVGSRKGKVGNEQTIDVETTRHSISDDTSVDVEITSPKTKSNKKESKIPRPTAKSKNQVSKNKTRSKSKMVDVDGQSIENARLKQDENESKLCDIYEFNENEEEKTICKNANVKKNCKKTETTRTRRLQRSKVDCTEKTRSDSESEDEKLFRMDDSLTVKDDESEMIDTDLGEDVSFSVQSQDDVYEYDNLIIHEVTENDEISLNESIEIFRGDNKAGKGTRKGRTQKKAEKEVGGSEEQASGETTEVLRSSKLLKRSQVKSEKVVKIDSVPKTDSQTSNNQLIQTLEEAYKQVQHLPSPPVYSSICHMLALQYMDSFPLKAAFYLAESIAVTFRHQSLVNASRKIRKSSKLNESTEAVVRENASAEVNNLQKSREILHFNKTEEEFKTMMTQIPEDWSVCQISVISHSTPAVIMISRLDREGQPIVVQLPGFNAEQGREILLEFSTIINESRETMKITEKNDWWKLRRGLDTRLQTLLDNMEKFWLGRWKFLLLGNPVGVSADDLYQMTEDIMKMLAELSDQPINRAVIRSLLQSGNILTIDQLNQVLTNLTDADEVSEVSKAVTQFWNKHIPSDVKRHHVILLLDKMLQHLPWENLPILRCHSLSRLPSLYHMINYLSQTVENTGVSIVDKQKVYYVLNPDNNLPATQETFQDWFLKTKGWQGIVGKPPTAEQYKAALTQYDLLVYCGHGNGNKYLNGDDLQQLKCRAAVFLMGCSSGQLQTRGQLEASGMMLNYFLANCPCIVSNLWDVTDKDIDRFLEHLLQSCLSDKPCDVLSKISTAREACRLPFLIGAAPVVYGFPIVTRVDKSS
ncbi:ESP1 [Mytilus coruscus]|uniref:separase n=1 Tax=Mytilus coruscus TaxID=42192 RepID=A0A6J8BMZ4_MYTCO|nr:ESP1 [Mytilus coruscus]